MQMTKWPVDVPSIWTVLCIVLYDKQISRHLFDGFLPVSRKL